MHKRIAKLGEGFLTIKWGYPVTLDFHILTRDFVIFCFPMLALPEFPAYGGVYGSIHFRGGLC